MKPSLIAAIIIALLIGMIAVANRRSREEADSREDDE